MTYSDVLPLCLFFKGETEAPSHFGKEESCLWFAEKMACEQFPSLISKKNPRASLAHVVYAYIGKWNPWEANDLMNVYFDRAPELRNSLELV